MVNKNAERDRKAKVEAMRRQQAGAERRRTILVASAAAAVVVVLIVVVAVVVIGAQADRDLARRGVAASAAGCDPVVSEPADGVSQHVETVVEYANVPPMFGEHNPSPAFPASPFYTASDRPSMEQLVHNLEHGYTVVWYTDDLPEDQVETLRGISELARDLSETQNGKFSVSAWDPAYGDFPDGMRVGMSHWGAEQGYQQLCSDVSGEAVEQFVQDYPANDSPEPNGA